MQGLVIFLVLWLLLPLCGLAQEQPLLMDPPDEINYSLGYDLGQQLQKADLAFNPELLWQALNDGLVAADGGPAKPAGGALYDLGSALGRTISTHKIEFRARPLWQGLYDRIGQGAPRVPDAQMAALLTPIHDPARTEEEPVASFAPKPQTATPIPKPYFRSAGARLLAENARRQGVVSLASGLQYRVITAGRGQRPGAADRVLTNYVSRPIENRVWTEAEAAGPGTTRELRVNKVIPGLAEALKLMHVGDAWEVYVPRRLAYRSGPLHGRALVINLELLDILPEFH